MKSRVCSDLVFVALVTVGFVFFGDDVQAGNCVSKSQESSDASQESDAQGLNVLEVRNAQARLAGANLELFSRSSALAVARKQREAAVERLGKDGGAAEVEEAVAAVAEAEHENEEARNRVLCMQADVDSVRRAVAPSMWITGSFALAGSVDGTNYIGGGLQFGHQSSVSTAWEVAVMADAFAPQTDDRWVRLSLLPRLYFGGVRVDGIQSALLLGVGGSLVLADSREQALVWQIGGRFRPVFVAGDGLVSDIKLFAQPQVVVASDWDTKLRGERAPVSVLFGFEVAFGAAFGSPKSAPRWRWK